MHHDYNMNNSINWLPLRLNILPLLDLQAHSVLQKYHQITKDIMQGDILALSSLQQLKLKVEERIKQIDEFYDKHAMDPRCKYLFSIRMLLVKIAQSKNQFEKLNEDYSSIHGDQTILTPVSDSDKNHINIAQYLKTPRPPQVSTTPRKVVPQTENTKKYEASNTGGVSGSDKKGNVYLSDLKRDKPKSRSPWRVQSSNRKAGQRKVEMGRKNQGQTRMGQDKKEFEREREEWMERHKDSDIGVQKSVKDLSQLVFTIKMTKSEYNEFMHLKRKNNHA